MQRERRSSFRVEYDTSVSEDVKAFTPTGCFFLDTSDPIKLRMSHALSSVFFSLYGFVPSSLEVVHEVTGAPPVKLNLEDPSDVGYVMFVKRLVKLVCRTCLEGNSSCPWASAIRSLRVS